MWEPDRHRTSFAQLQRRLIAGAAVRQLAAEYPATLVAFDLLQNPDGDNLMSQPLARRRAGLTQLLADAPSTLTLCPQTTDREEAAEWVTAWTAAGVEGLIAKNPKGRYTPGRRGWLKIKTRVGAEAIIGGVTGSISQPETVLLGRFDAGGRRSPSTSSASSRSFCPGRRDAAVAASIIPGRSRCRPAGPATFRRPSPSPTSKWSRPPWPRSIPGDFGPA